MKINVTLNSMQIYEEKTDNQTTKTQGELHYKKDEIVLEFSEKYEDQEIKFKMIILQDKVISIRQDQQMIFDLKQDDLVKYETPYGIMNMKVHTKKIYIKKEEEQLNEITLEYEIELDNNMKYMNKVNILID